MKPSESKINPDNEKDYERIYEESTEESVLL